MPQLVLLHVLLIFVFTISMHYAHVISSDGERIQVKNGFRFVPADIPTNLTTTVSVFDVASKTLKLNISWTPSSGGRRASSFNVHVWAQNESDKHCSSDPYYAFIEDPNCTSWLVSPGALHDTSTFSMHPGCLYVIRLEANPHNGNTFLQTEIKIPDCVDGACSCRHSELLGKPEVFVTPLDKSAVNITWFLSDLRNISSFIVRVGPKLLEGATSAMYNLSWYRQVDVTSQNVYYKLHSTSLAGKYAAAVRAVDYKKCWGPEGQRIFTLEPDGGQWIFSMNKISWRILLPAGSFLLLSLLAIRNRKCFYWLKILNSEDYFADHTMFYSLTRIKSERVFRRSKPLLERNVLYIEKEIEDAKAQGEVDNFEISFNRLVFKREIGRGTFGKVFLAMADSIRGVAGPRPVAVKVLKAKVGLGEKEDFLEEIAMLKKVGQHPNIVSLVACCTLKSDICMVMEFVPCGDLLKYLRNIRQHLNERMPSVASMSDGMYSTTATDTTSLNSYIYPSGLGDYTKTTIISTSLLPPIMPASPVGILNPSNLLFRGLSSGLFPPGLSEESSHLNYKLDHKELHNFARQIAMGMSHLESKRITHRDLAARNVLIDNNKVLKISDFGLSRRGVYVNTRRRKVPLRWLSVEAMRDAVYSNKSDVWAFAILLWEIGTLGGFPYPTVTDYNLLQHLEQGNRLDQPEIVSKELYTVMLLCWAESPQERPTFAELVSYFKTSPQSLPSVYVDIRDPMLPPTSAYVPMRSLLRPF